MPHQVDASSNTPSMNTLSLRACAAPFLSGSYLLWCKSNTTNPLPHPNMAIINYQQVKKESLYLLNVTVSKVHNFKKFIIFVAFIVSFKEFKKPN